MSSDRDKSWFAKLEAALTSGDQITVGVQEMNDACDHIVRLLTDASMLLENGSHATATFLAITSLEEIAKTHVGMYRKGPKVRSRQKDPLFQHNKKHQLAAAPTVAMGGRLQDAIGEDRVRALIAMADAGDLVQLREQSIYLESNASVMTIPEDAIDPRIAREILLFAIEAFDDALVGYTNYSIELSKSTDALFDRLKDGF